jgi:O-antigen/teichoic acid export membrane protein
LLLAAIFSGFIAQVGGMGYELFYLQHKGDESEKRKILEQVYNLRLVTNFTLFLIQSIIGLYLYLLTDNKVSGGILILMAVSLLLEGFNAPQETLLKDQMAFQKITIGNIFKEFFATIGKIAAALLGLGGLSFGVGPVLGSLVRLFYLRKVQPYRQEYFIWDKLKVREIFNFGKHVLFGSGAMYIVQQVDRIFLIMFFPQNVVGRYGFAWGNASMPFNYLVMTQAQLTMTYISKFNSEGIKLFEKLNLITRLISLIFIPLTLIGVIYAREIIQLVFTEKWVSTAPIVSILLLYYLYMTITFAYAFLLTGLGYPKLTSRITIYKAIVLILALVFINILMVPNIIIYTIVFTSLSIVFEIIKMFVGIYKLNVGPWGVLQSLKYETILVILVTVLSAFAHSNDSDVGSILIVLFVMIMYVVLFFKYNFAKTVLAIEIISPPVARALNKYYN